VTQTEISDSLGFVDDDGQILLTEKCGAESVVVVGYTLRMVPRKIQGLTLGRIQVGEVLLQSL
jgi:uncharacterized Rossmann fold enzyme